MSSTNLEPSIEKIEVGAAGADLRYWRAKEAVRQGELRLSAQATMRTGLEARATAITGLASASLLAVAAGTLSAAHWIVWASGGAVLIPLPISAAACVHAARPKDPAMVGYDPSVIIDGSDDLGTELEILEAMSEGFTPGIQKNYQDLKTLGWTVRIAGGLLIAAPLLGAATYATLVAFRPGGGLEPRPCPSERVWPVAAEERMQLP